MTDYLSVLSDLLQKARSAGADAAEATGALREPIHGLGVHQAPCQVNDGAVRPAPEIWTMPAG